MCKNAHDKPLARLQMHPHIHSHPHPYPQQHSYPQPYPQPHPPSLRPTSTHTHTHTHTHKHAYLQGGAAAQVVGHQCLVSLGQTQLPRQACVRETTYTLLKRDVQSMAGSLHTPDHITILLCAILQCGQETHTQVLSPTLISSSKSGTWRCTILRTHEATCVLDAAPLCGASATVVAADEHVVGMALHHTCVCTRVRVLVCVCVCLC